MKFHVFGKSGKALSLTFWGWIAMFAIKRIGYKGWSPVEIDGHYFLVLIPNDVELPQGGDALIDDCQGETNEAC